MIAATLILAVIAFVGFGIYKSSALKQLHIQKTVTINGSLQKVFDQVRYLNNFPKWSPFLAQDPTQQYSIKGTDGVAGAQYHWLGNKGKDLGYQEIVSVEPGIYISTKCNIQKPFTAKPTFEYSFIETQNGIQVKQDFRLQSASMDAFFMWLFNAKASMETTNTQGLTLLKQSIENNN